MGCCPLGGNTGGFLGGLATWADFWGTSDLGGFLGTSDLGGFLGTSDLGGPGLDRPPPGDASPCA